jgi:hypothetical protein
MTQQVTPSPYHLGRQLLMSRVSSQGSMWANPLHWLAGPLNLYQLIKVAIRTWALRHYGRRRR